MSLPMIDIHRDAETAWPDLRANAPIPSSPPTGHYASMEPPHAPTIAVALLRDGMASGRGAAIIRLDWPNGATVVVQTSALALYTAARSLMVMDGQL